MNSKHLLLPIALALTNIASLWLVFSEHSRRVSAENQRDNVATLADVARRQLSDRLAERSRISKLEKTATPEPAVSSITPPSVNAGRPGSEAAPLQLLAHLHKTGVVRLPQLVSPDGTLNPAFTDLFKLKKADREKAAALVRDTIVELQKAAAGEALYSRSSDGAIVIEIPPFPAGDQIQRKFEQSMGSVMGADGWKMLSDGGYSISGAAMFGFGAEARKITITTTADMPAGKSIMVGEDIFSAGTRTLKAIPMTDSKELYNRYGAIVETAVLKVGAIPKK